MSRRPYRIGRRRARRLLDGDPGVRAADARLASVLDALASPNAQPNAQEDAESAPPPEVPAAFARHAGSAPRAGRGGARSGSRGGARSRLGRSVAVKTAVAVLALSGGTMAAAAADALPGPAQRAAHKLFGSWGVPAPSATPPRHGQDPAPNTGSVLPEGTAPAGRPGASPNGSGPGSAGRGADTGDCANPGEGNGDGGDAACTATGGQSGSGGNDQNGDQNGQNGGGDGNNGDGGDNGNGNGGGNGNGNGGGGAQSTSSASSASAGVSAAPALTPSTSPTVHEPPGRVKKTTHSPDA